jgi:uncharacterized protein YraI
VNSIRDLVEADRAMRNAVVNSGAQQALRSIQREHRQAFELAAQLTSVAEQARKASGVDDAFSQLRDALNITSSQQLLLDRTSQQALSSVSSLTGSIAQRFAKEQSISGLGSIAKNLLGLQPLRDSVSEAMAQLNIANSLSSLDGYGNQAAAQNEAAQSAMSAYQKYFDGIGKQNQRLLDSVGTFALADRELSAKFGSILGGKSDLFAGLDVEALTGFSAGNAFQSLNSVVSSFATALDRPSEFGKLLSASQMFSESTRQMLEGIASASAFANQQALSSVTSLVDFSTARALNAASAWRHKSATQLAPNRRRRARKSPKGLVERQIQEMVAVSHAGESIAEAIKPLLQEMQTLNLKVDAAIKSKASWYQVITLWVGILGLLAALAQVYLVYKPSQPSATYVGYVASSEVNLRVGPATTHPVIMKLGLHQLVEIKIRRGVWCQIVTPTADGHRIGWIHSRYLRAVDEISKLANNQTDNGFSVSSESDPCGKPDPSDTRTTH